MVINENQKLVFEDRYKFENETINGMWDRVAKAAASVEKDKDYWHEQFFNLLKDFKFLPGGRILSTLGTGVKRPLFNCYVIPSPEDSRQGIMDNVRKMVEIMAHGGGVGVDLSTLRPKGSPVKGVNGKSSGVVAWANLYSEATGTIIQGGSRRGALLLSLRVDHPDIIDFIKAKENPNVLNNANLSVLITDKFMKAVKADEDWHLMWGNEVFNTVKARYLWQLIAEKAWASGEPGVIFIDTYNKMSNTWYFEDIVTTNPCGEQGLPPDGVCNLGHMNLSAYIDTNTKSLNHDKFCEDVKVAVRFLDNIIDVSDYLYRENKNAVRQSRRIGLGMLGIADALLKMELKYGDKKALDFIDEVFYLLKIVAYSTSIDLAEEKGAFPKFDREKYLQGEFIKGLPENIRHKIYSRGIRNATLLTIAPTGSTGLLANASSGIEPIFNWETKRKDRLGERVIRHWFVEDKDINNLPEYAVTAHEISPENHILMQAAAQKHIDSSISKTINLPNKATVEDVIKAYELAYELGCKGCTVYRDGSRDAQVLSSTNNTSVKNNKPLARGEWKRKAPDTIYHLRKVYIGCGKLILMIGWSDIEKSIQDLYVISSGSGGCICNLQGMIISMSGMLRLGGSLFNIEKAFKGISTCNSFTAKRATKEGKLSKGKNCGTAILNAIKEFIAEKENYETEKANECVATTPNTPKLSPNNTLPNTDICPICKTPLVRMGCWTCPECGYSKCE